MQPKSKKPRINEHDLITYSSEDFLKQQLTELYSGIKSTPKSTDDNLKQFILNLKPTKIQTIDEAFTKIKSKKSEWPLPDDFVIPTGRYKFLPPVHVETVGGVRTSTHLPSSTGVDLLLTLPDEFCQPKDYLNGRYIVKRAVYLVQLAPKLLKCPDVEKIKFLDLFGDLLKPVLQVRLKSGTSYNLIPSISTEVFKTSLLSADKNALRPDKVLRDCEGCVEEKTPYYNSSVLTDIKSSEFTEFYPVLEESDSLKQALTILKFWCSTKNVISGHVATGLFIHLHSTGVISPQMDTFTTLKQIWGFLSIRLLNLTTSGFVMGTLDRNVDHLGMYNKPGANILYTTPLQGIVELARHSQIMMTSLASAPSSFLDLLTGKVSDIFQLYDMVFEIDISSVSFPQQLSLQYCGVKLLSKVQFITDLLTRAYGDRVTGIKVQCDRKQTWLRQKQVPIPDSIRVGLNLHKDHWRRVVERGPSADTPESKEFKKFWGSKSKLRRFQDSSIVEAVVWECKTESQRGQILLDITRHILQLHGGLTNIKPLQLPSLLPGGDGQEQALKIIQTFSQLTKILRGCDKIPLAITSVTGVSPVLRQTELYPQTEYSVRRADSNPDVVTAHQIVCHFESSGKWPEDVRGILRLKTAFYLALKEELQSMHITSKVNPDFIDIIKNGFVFRLVFYVPKESKLRTSNISFWVPSSAEELILKTETQPTVSSHLTSLSLQNPAFSLTVRHLKKWVAFNKLSNYIPDIFVELVVAHTFLSTQGFSSPLTPTAGLIRTLNFLSTFDWNLYPLFVNFNDDLPTETIQVYDSFMTSRKSYPAACIVTPGNETSLLTKTSPSTTSLKILKNMAMKCTALPAISTAQVPEYNVVIHLRRNKTGRYNETPQTHHAKSTHVPLVEYEPARFYVETLTEAYDKTCLFFYNKYFPDSVGVVAKKPQNSEIKFSVNNSAGKVLGREGRVTDNYEAMISDFYLMGKGLVQNIEIIDLDI